MISEQTAHERFNRLVSLINKISLEKNQRYINKEYGVMVEGISKNDKNRYTGRTDDFKLVNFTSDLSLDEIEGTIVPVLITGAKTFSLEGRTL